ncbi:LuxR C-terminal-related transcriptional regulator [Oricola sp.]|uniref:LuxR C-terminal-related transcriptional regulator n=1 Tax=Oricola sp. TaxID=1979950 RepID=UPI0025D9D10C|nr:LuxR C-terminal-related transcriptional regulator [Oricola sp.]MCI5073679.1 LuxR C-terminal-related transcriptional regulator [Oricola sp.]
MAEAVAFPVSTSGAADEETAIAAVIHAETQAFVDGDFEAWAKCWVQDDRAHSMCVNARTGLSVESGWPAIAADMKHVLENDLGCDMVRFRKDNLQISIDGNTAWVVYDQWAENRAGATWECFETRILERDKGSWKIAYSSFVELRHDKAEKDTLSVDANGRVLWASPETLEKLKDHPLLTVSTGRVRARRREWDRTLQAAIAQAGRYHGFFELRRFGDQTGGPFRYPAVLGDTDDGGVAVVHVSVRDCTTYLTFDSDGSLDHRLSVAQMVFGLSDGQRRVAFHIANGMGLKSAAEALGISVNTARTHLARLYEKTGVSSQTALVRLLLSVG